MFCSTVIPTVGRSTLSRAVTSVLNQTLAADEFEVIVVNDSGQPIPQADWHRSARVQIISANRRERSVARNTGAAIAKGRYLHFLDDDDWLFPDALQHLWALAESSDDAWLYGSTQLVDRQRKPIIQLRHGLNGNCFVHVMAGEWIPLQASLIRAETFFSVGGFNPHISGPEDIDLLRRIALHGDLAETDQLVVYIARGEDGSTTDYSRHAEMRRWSRELTLDSPGVLSRFRASAGSSYLHGRILRVYLTSVVWNLQHGRLFAALSRATFGLASFSLAGRYVLSASYWRALARVYENKTFIRGFQEARGPVEPRASKANAPGSVGVE
jgi:glycosyltransferase involved in cell wall biosynthesis